MAGIPFTDIADAVLVTQENLVKRGAFLDLQTDLMDHVAVREMWKRRQRKFEGGHPWDFHAQIDHNYSAGAVGLFATDGTALTDTMIRGTVQPRHVNAHYIFDLREPDFQRGGTKIVDLVKTRYVAMMVSFWEYLETVLWTKPTDDTDLLTPYGMTYWITKSTTEGFNGGNATGFSSGKASIDQGTYARWANWTNDYEEVTKQDLLRSMRRGHRNIQFRSPVSHSQPELGAMGNGIYTNDEVIGYAEELVEAQNMDLGNDLASKDGRSLFKGTPLTFVPKLDDDTENPVYMLDWKWLAIGVMPGWENELSKPYMVPNKHNVRRVDLDCTLQMVATNLRRQAVFHDPA